VSKQAGTRLDGVMTSAAAPTGWEEKTGTMTTRGMNEPMGIPISAYCRAGRVKQLSVGSKKKYLIPKTKDCNDCYARPNWMLRAAAFWVSTSRRVSWEIGEEGKKGKRNGIRLLRFDYLR
jgi:hypothetical protein